MDTGLQVPLSPSLLFQPILRKGSASLDAGSIKMSDEKEILLLDRDMKRFVAACFAMSGALANPNREGGSQNFAEASARWADFLLKELDKVEDL